jgi:hypothetical protein
MVLLGAVWTAVVLFGLTKLLAHQFTPGQQAPDAAKWPANVNLSRRTDYPTLILVAHPKCPCTAASLRELSRIVAQCERKLTAYVLFLKPKRTGGDWNLTSGVPGVNALPDQDGAMARALGAATSGQVMLFDRDGLLKFSGGITASRGHDGDNLGHDAIVSLVKTGRSGISRTPVFGCSLLEPSTKP